MKYYLSLLLILFAAAAHSEELPQASLFFTPQETRQAEALAAKTAPAGTADVHLGAVMYYGPGDWVLWLQGTRWTPQTANDHLQVLGVSLSEVHMSWHGDEDQPPQEFTLKPNETFQIATGQVIAGP